MSDKTWNAQWIWCDAGDTPSNFYLLCRKRFTLAEKPGTAPIRITADSRYKIFANGHFVGRGPVRCSPKRQYFDPYELGPFLHAGENVIAVIVHHFGISTYSYELGRGGLLLQGTARGSHGQEVRLDTDASWRVLPGAAWERCAPRSTYAMMWMELYDARRAPRAWQRPGYDDAAWQQPRLLGTPPIAPWETLVERDIPYLAEQAVPPIALVESGTVQRSNPTARFGFLQAFGLAPLEYAALSAQLFADSEHDILVSLQRASPNCSWCVWLDHVRHVPRPVGAHPQASGELSLGIKKGWNEFILCVDAPSVSGVCAVQLLRESRQSEPLVRWHSERSEDSRNAFRVAKLSCSDTGMRGSLAGVGAWQEVSAMLESLPQEVIRLDHDPWGNVALNMALDTVCPQRSSHIAAWEVLLQGRGGGALISPRADGQDIYAVFDFGKIFAGHVRLRLKGSDGGVIDLCYSEALVSGRVDCQREGVNYADRYIMRDGPQAWEMFFPKSMRYVQLTFRDLHAPVCLENLEILSTHYPVANRGRFGCSDSLLNKIWRVGSWTLQLCMQDGYIDTPWREQAQWAGDALVEMLANYAVFGDCALARKGLRQVAEGQRADGSLPANCPGLMGPIPQGIPTFTLQWASALYNHYLYTGDEALARTLLPSVVRLFSYFDAFLDATGLLADVPGFVFLDWMADDELMPRFGDTTFQGVLTGLNCNYYLALADAARLAESLAENDLARTWRQRAGQVKASINHCLWSEEVGAYLHGRVGGAPIRRLAVHDSILAVYAGVADCERARRSMSYVLASEHADAIQIGTPYFLFFYFRALRSAGYHKEVLEVMRKAYGAMIDKGATAWWEHFHGEGSHSHAWSCGPNIDLPNHVLGVRPLEPGFAAVRIEPQVYGLSYASGVVPTPQGDITVEWSFDAQTFRMATAVPFPSRVELSIPATALATITFEGPQPLLSSGLSGERAFLLAMGPGEFSVTSFLEPDFALIGCRSST